MDGELDENGGERNGRIRGGSWISSRSWLHGISRAAFHFRTLSVGMCGKPKFYSDSVFKTPNRPKIWHPLRRFSDRNCMQIRHSNKKWIKVTFTCTKCADKGPFIATQLNSTELSWTQLDVELSTRSQREQLSPINERSDPVDSVCRSWRHKQKQDWLVCTLFNWVSWVQLSWVVSL